MIVEESGEFRIEDLIADEDVVITVTNTGYIKRTADLDVPQAAARRQGPDRHAHARGGLRQPPLHRLDARLHPDLLRPRPGYWLKVYEIPDVGPGGKGKAIANLVAMEEGEKIAALLAVKEFPSRRTSSSS